MSIIKDILDFKDDVQNMSDDVPVKNNMRGSIAKEASPGILQFSVLASPTSSLQELTMVNKALERNYVSFIAIITSIDSVTDEKSIQQYLQRIHQNFGGDMITGMRESALFGLPTHMIGKLQELRESEENTICVMKQFKGDDGQPCLDDDCEEIVNYNNLDQDDKDKVKPILKEKCKEAKCYKFNTNDGVNSIVIKEDANTYKHIFLIKNFMNEDAPIKIIESVSFRTEGKGINKALLESNMLKESVNALKEYVPDLNMYSINEKTTENDNYSIIGTGLIKNKYSEASVVTDNMDREFQSSAQANRVDRSDIVLKDVLRDNDVKKSNELVPTMMHLKTYFKDKNGSLNAVDYLIGVKAIIHPINSDSMMENLVSSVKRGKGFFNLMRLTTGEISFFKDFVFAINRIKGDIKSKYKDNPWWNALVRRKKYSGVLKVFNTKQQLIPNTTIVISMEEVEKIKMDHNIDVMDLKTAKDIMDNLFLLGFVVIDSSVETVHFLFDGQRHFQQYSYNQLERENSNSAKEIQNVMQLLGRM